MGQFYRALLRQKGDIVYFLDPHFLGAYSKLMEHSWLGNSFVSAVMVEIQDNPMRVAWMGDYAAEVAKENLGKGAGFIATEEQFQSLYDKVWDGEQADVNRVEIKTEDTPLQKACPRYLINNTKKVYIDMETYFDDGGFRLGDNIWCIAPLPLLTAVGNGLGGGDYIGENMELVGSWAFDEMLTSDHQPPAGYTCIKVAFKEKEEH